MESTNGKEKEPIEWLILKKEKDRALLWSKDVLDHYVYDERIPNKENNFKPFNSDWKDSSLRTWLNGYFYNEAFSDAEKNIILKTELDNSYLAIKALDDYEQDYLNTKDKIFILAINEILDFPELSTKNRKLTARATKYASNVVRNNTKLSLDKDRDKDIKHQKIEGYIAPYWLRTSEASNMAYSFWTEEQIDKYGLLTNSNYSSIGVRPAIWVKFNGEKYEAIKNQEIVMAQENQRRKEEIAQNRVFDVNRFNVLIETTPCVKDYEEGIDINNIATIQIGNYYYTENKDRKDIDWLVLNKDAEKRVATLISKEIIESEPFDNNVLEQKYWHNCSLRIFLNTNFYNEAFTNEEKKVIEDYITTNLIGKDKYGESVDKIAIASYYEIQENFKGVSVLSDDNNSKAMITQYALNKSNYDLDVKNGYGKYWLRDTDFAGRTQCMSTNGSIRIVDRSLNGYKKIGVRPIIKVKY